MPVRIILILLCICSVLIVAGINEQSNNSTGNASSKLNVNNDPGFYSKGEHEQLRKELDVYIADKSSEYKEQLSEAIRLFAHKQYEDADKLLHSTRSQYPDQPDLLSHHAETIAMMNNGSFTGKPFDLLSRSLDIDTRHKPSLWMMALVNQQMGNHDAAVILFQLLKREISPDGSSSQTIDSAMDVSVTYIESQIEDDVVSSTKDEPESAAQSAVDKPEINLYITLEPEILNTFLPDDTVYIYAQDPNGSDTPLAVTRRRVSDFPTIVTLDDSMAMMPELTLSSSEIVTVGARASRSGTAMPLTGDWEVELYEVPVETTEVIPLNIHYELK